MMLLVASLVARTMAFVMASSMPIDLQTASTKARATDKQHRSLGRKRVSGGLSGVMREGRTTKEKRKKQRGRCPTHIRLFAFSFVLGPRSRFKLPAGGAGR